MKLGKIFYILGKYGKINIRKIRDCEVNNDYLNDLVTNGVLTPINDYDYKVDSVDQLVEYGRFLINEKHYSDANTIFMCAYQTDPNNFNANYQLLYRELIQREEEIEFKYFDVVYKGLKDYGYENEANYYLFVFGALYIAPNYLGLDFSGMQLFKLVPYVVTLIILIITSMINKRETQPPTALGVNYFREDR